MRHRVLGPLFVLLFVLMLALWFLHAVHDGQDAGSALGAFCLGLTVMFGLIVLIRLRWRVVVPIARVRVGRAPPQRPLRMPSARPALLEVPIPLRI